MVISDEKISEQMKLELKLLEGLKMVNPDDLVELLKDGLVIKGLKCSLALILFSSFSWGATRKDLTYVTETTDNWIYYFLHKSGVKESLNYREKILRKPTIVKKGDMTTYRPKRIGAPRNDEKKLEHSIMAYYIPIGYSMDMSGYSDFAKHTGDLQPIILKEKLLLETKFAEPDIIKLWAPILYQTFERVIEVIRLRSPDNADEWASKYDPLSKLDIQPLTLFPDYASDIRRVVEEGASAIAGIPNKELYEYIQSGWQNDPLIKITKEKEKLREKTFL